MGFVVDQVRGLGFHTVIPGHSQTVQQGGSKIPIVEGHGLQNNSYAIVEVHPDGSITITGYRKAISTQLRRNT